MKGIKDQALSFDQTNELRERGFSFYEYISFKELRQTIRLDYYQAMDRIMVLSSILFVALFLSYYVYLHLPESTVVLDIENDIVQFSNGMEQPFYLFIIELFVAIALIPHAFIMPYLCIRFIYRSYHYWYLRLVLVTENGFVLNKNIHIDGDNDTESGLLNKYEKMFSERLFGKSKIEDKVDSAWTHYFCKYTDLIDKLNDISEKRKFLSFITFPVQLYLTLYGLLYFVGIALSYVMGLLLVIIVRAIIRLMPESRAYRIQKKMQLLDQHINKLNDSIDTSEGILNKFRYGDISDISAPLGEEYRKIHENFNAAAEEVAGVEKLITEAKYERFIDFVKLQDYLKNCFNRPVDKMLEFLENTKETIESQVYRVDVTLMSDQDNPQIQAQRERLIMTLQDAEKNIAIFKKIRL